MNICYLRSMYSWITAKNKGKRLLACKAHEVLGIDRAMQERWLREVEEKLYRSSFKKG